jgi:hypothetical protein
MENIELVSKELKTNMENIFPEKIYGRCRIFHYGKYFFGAVRRYSSKRKDDGC